MTQKEKTHAIEERKRLERMKIESLGIYCWGGKLVVFPHSNDQVAVENATNYINSK